jgi:hypothetical protein
MKGRDENGREGEGENRGVMRTLGGKEGNLSRGRGRIKVVVLRDDV